MTILQALILSIIQGITEFLPISSSGHLILVPHLLGWEDQGLSFDVMVHMATALAVMVYYRKRIQSLLCGLSKNKPQEVKLVATLLVSIVPAMVVGIFFRDIISTTARSVQVVTFSLFAWGIVMILAELFAKRNSKKIEIDEMKPRQGFLIGLAQALALIPGTSRSGITLSAGYFLRIKREDAVMFSFLMAVPVILGAGFLNILDLIQSNEPVASLSLVTAFIGAFLSGLLAIHIIRLVIAKNGLIYFGIYRICLAIFLFIYFF